MNITKGKRAEHNWTWHDYGETIGENDLRRVYDRLRKRSYRAIVGTGEEWGPWWQDDHEAYVKGVRDALNEVLSA